MRIIQDLRIGTKLAITSALTILVVAAMIYLQMSGGAEVRKADDNAARQQAIAQSAAEAKASVRGHADGHPRRSDGHHSDELKKADDYFAARTAAALKFTGEMAKLSQSAENGERIAEAEGSYRKPRSRQGQIEIVRKQELAIEAKNADHSAEASAQMAKLVEEVARIRKEVDRADQRGNRGGRQQDHGLCEGPQRTGTHGGRRRSRFGRANVAVGRHCSWGCC